MRCSRTGPLTAVILFAVSPANAAPQISLPDPAAIRNVQVVDITKFRQSHPSFTLLLSPLPDMPHGQIPNYGGPLQNYLNYSASFPMRDVIPPFGGSGLASFAHGRAQLFSNIGGIFVPFQSSWTRPNAWFTQATFGARIALDPGHHLWVGGTGRYTADFADKKRQNGLWSADLTFQSGH